MLTFAFNMVYTHLYPSLLWLNFFKIIFQFIQRQGSLYFIHYNSIFIYEKCARNWFNIIQSSHFALFVMWNRKSQVVFVNEIINNEFTCIYTHCNYFNVIFIIWIQGLHIRNLLFTWFTIRSPKIQHDSFSL